MDAFEDFWSSSDLGDLPSAGEALEQERADARRDREWLLEQFGKYRDLADALAGIITESPLDEAQKEELFSTLTLVRYRLMQEPVRLLVLGASSAGKSTLVNALAGRVVSPEAQHSSTLIPAWIRSVDRDLGGEVAYNILKRNMTKKYMARPAYLKMYCHPPEDKNTNPDDYAVIADVEGGFLADSGLMLLDTPGVDQTDADTRMTVRTAELGAEMVLMIIRSNVFSQQETALYKKLFPDGELDLGLDVPKDVFSVYNVMPGNPDPPTNVVDSIREMTDGKLDTDARLYSIDVLQERQRFEPYRYYDWAPLDIGNEEEIQKLKKDQSREKHGYTVGASQRPYGYDLLKGTTPGPEMERLTDDLRRRAWALCAEKQRICVPILDALSGVAVDLKKVLTSQLEEIRQGAEEDAHKIDGAKLRSRSPEFSKLVEELDAFDQKSEEIGGKQQTLLMDVDNVRAQLGKAADHVKSVAGAKFNTASELFENIDMSLSALRSNAQGMVDSLRFRIRSLAPRWQNMLAGEQFLLLSDENAIRRIDIREALAGLGKFYNYLAGRVNKLIGDSSIHKLDPEKAADLLMKEYDRDVSKGLTSDEDITEAMREIGSSPMLKLIQEPGEDVVPPVLGTKDPAADQSLASRMTNWVMDKSLLSSIRQKATGALLQLERHDLAAFTDGIRAFADTIERSDYIAAIRQPPFKDALDKHREKLMAQAVQAAKEAYDAIAAQLFEERSRDLQAVIASLDDAAETIVALMEAVLLADPAEEAFSEA